MKLRKLAMIAFFLGVTAQAAAPQGIIKGTDKLITCKDLSSRIDAAAKTAAKAGLMDEAVELALIANDYALKCAARSVSKKGGKK